MTQPATEQCPAHSGISQSIRALEDFRGRQEGIGGVNERIFDRLDKINAKLSWVLGGAVGIGFLLGLVANQIRLH